jgi:hypothetical protein
MLRDLKMAYLSILDIISPKIRPKITRDNKVTPLTTTRSFTNWNRFSPVFPFFRFFCPGKVLGFAKEVPSYGELSYSVTGGKPSFLENPLKMYKLMSNDFLIDILYKFIYQVHIF